jgi:DNA-binding CsgD family transcriptional regulator
VQTGDSAWTYRQTGKPRRSPAEAPSPHLPQTERTTEVYAPSGHGLIVLDGSGRVQSITDRARVWLNEYFNAPSSVGNLPAALVTWLKEPAAAFADSQSPVRDPLVVARDQKQLVVRVAPAGSGQRLLLLTEEQPAYSIDLLLTLGLTRREAEVLHWLAEGKTNAEISAILGVSQHTVNKHTEHIFAKLGVENRNRALLAVLDKLGRAAG